jgi:hypothetical protein
MPTIAEEGQYKFVIYTRENTFEPPHVHIFVGSEDVCRLELNGGQFMDEPPPGEYRSMLEVYRKHAAAIREQWDRIHKR